LLDGLAAVEESDATVLGWIKTYRNAESQALPDKTTSRPPPRDEP